MIRLLYENYDRRNELLYDNPRVYAPFSSLYGAMKKVTVYAFEEELISKYRNASTLMEYYECRDLVPHVISTYKQAVRRKDAVKQLIMTNLLLSTISQKFMYVVEGVCAIKSRYTLELDNSMADINRRAACRGKLVN